MGHAGLFLRALHQANAAYVREASLHERACGATGAAMAPLLLALHAAPLPRAVDAVMRGCVTNGQPADLVLLLKQLRNLGHPTKRRAGALADLIISTVVHTWPVQGQAALVVALAAADLSQDAEALAAQAAGQAKFKRTLKGEQTKHAQKLFSRAFWREDPLETPRTPDPRWEWHA